MDPAVPEGEVRSRRLKSAILVGLAVTAAQFLAFALIAYRAHVSLGSDSSPLRIPLVLFSFLHRGQIVYPILGGIKFGNRNFSFTEVRSLRHVDLADGRTRDTTFPIVANPTGIVSNEDRLWCFGLGNEVYETDGTNISNWKTQRTLKLGASFPFLYEDRPAFVERSPNGRFLLFVLTDREWEPRGEIAIPGADRSWMTDEQTSRKVLIPRTCAGDAELKSKEIVPQIVSANGRIHQFIPDSGAGACYRAGFDFVDRNENAECVSAFVPENDQADTAGWVLLDSKLKYDSKSFFGRPQMAIVNDELYLASDARIWCANIGDGLTESTDFEEIDSSQIKGRRTLSIVSSSENKTVYIVASNEGMDGEVFRLDRGGIQKLPFQIDGFFKPLKEWVAIVAVQSLAVFILGALALSCISAWLKRPSSYSFGHDTVVLAPLVRRSSARIFDLTLIFGPLAGRALWCVVMTSSPEMVDYAQDSNAPSLASLVLPSIVWAVVMWSICVLSTGLWGMTPGKWLFSVRVVRSTLRPCGVLQALLRELLVWVDSPQLVWPMPGLVCQLMTENRQRIGDLVAGTIVIQLSKPASPLRGVS